MSQKPHNHPSRAGRLPAAIEQRAPRAGRLPLRIRLPYAHMADELALDSPELVPDVLVERLIRAAFVTAAGEEAAARLEAQFPLGEPGQRTRPFKPLTERQIASGRIEVRIRLPYGPMLSQLMLQDIPGVQTPDQRIEWQLRYAYAARFGAGAAEALEDAAAIGRPFSAPAPPPAAPQIVVLGPALGAALEQLASFHQCSLDVLVNRLLDEAHQPLPQRGAAHERRWAEMERAPEHPISPADVLDLAQHAWPLRWELDERVELPVVSASAGLLAVTIVLSLPLTIIGTLADRDFFVAETDDLPSALRELEQQFRHLVDVPPLSER